MRCPNYVKNCINALNEAGYKAYAVGGAVRDSILGKEPFDWDVTTSAMPEETLRTFANKRTIPTGLAHGTVTVLFEEDEKTHPVEITTFRVDGEYLDSRHPESVSFSRELTDDLSRRDFTVNAMAWNENEGIIDPFEGQKDIENKLIRAVGDPETRFTEDALRILRAYRFAAQLVFDIEEKTLVASASCAHLLKKIARERVGAEFKKLLAAPKVSYSLTKMIENGVWSALFDVPAPKHHQIIELSDTPNGNFAIRLSAIITDMTDEERDALLTSLRLSNAEKKLTLRLCKVKSFDVSALKKDDLGAAARRFLHLWGDIYTEATEMLRFFNQSTDSSELLYAIEFEKSKNRCLALADLAVKGSDLLPLCKGDHKKVGLTLSALLERVIEDPTLNDKNTLLSLAEKILKT